jgi:uncharacterized protein (TIGR02145 family)
MRKTLLLFFLISLGWSFSQTIENVDFRAEGKTIVVMYDFLHPKADTSVNIELQFKDQQGSVITPKTISGDLKNVKPGEGKRIVWDVIADGVILSGKYKAELKINRFNLNSVKIGNQVWMTENLNVDRFRNGDIIPKAKTKEEWIKAGNNQQPAWCYNEYDPANGKKYGKLYNWYAVNDERGLAPIGWHIPSDAEWTNLSNYLGGEWDAQKKLKSSSGWDVMCNGTNESGFSGLPGGHCNVTGNFFGRGNRGYWWCSTENSVATASCRQLILSQFEINEFKGQLTKNYGLSVRCIKD